LATRSQTLGVSDAVHFAEYRSGNVTNPKKNHVLYQPKPQRGQAWPVSTYRSSGSSISASAALTSNMEKIDIVTEGIDLNPTALSALGLPETNLTTSSCRRSGAGF
jgi:hypothetical protein